MIHEIHIKASEYGPLHAGTETGLIVDAAQLINVGDYLRVHELTDPVVAPRGHATFYPIFTGRKRLVEVKALERADGSDMIVCEIEILIKGVG